MARFEDLNDDTLYLILSYSRSERLSTLHCLRLVSKRLHLFADSVLYRTVVLEEDNDSQEQASYRFIERILDPADALRRHMRSLRIRSFKGDEHSSCMNIELLLACIHSIQKLDLFSWDARITLPDELLHALHQRHPSTRLCVSVRHLDQAAIASAQLHRLSISIPCSDVVHPDSVASFEQVKRVLIQCHGLRALTLDVHQDLKLRQAAEERQKGLGYPTRNEMPTKRTRGPSQALAGDFTLVNSVLINKIQLPLEPTNQLPSLEILELKARTYALDQMHCLQLYHCMDWTKLKRLSLGPSNATNFFTTFTNKIPLLEHLDFSYHSVPDSRFPYLLQAPLQESSRFIANQDKLKVLVIRCDIFDFSTDFWHHLVRTHGESLQELSLQARQKGLEAPICRTVLLNFPNYFTALTTLEFALNPSYLSYSTCENCSEPRHALDTNYVDTLPFVASLETIRISIRVHSCDHRSLHSYIADHAHCAIRKLWSLYSVKNPDHELQIFTIHFWRWETPSPHPDENGMNRNAYINEVVFDSRRTTDELVVRARNNRKTITTCYKEIWKRGDEGGIRAHYVPAQQGQPGQPFFLSDRFHGALGSLFQHPSGGRLVPRYH